MVNRLSRIVSGLPLSVILIAAALLPARTAPAQGTSGTLPRPITSLDLARYGEQLKLTEAQQQAVEAVHDEYKERFQALRDGEIAQFLGAMHKLGENTPLQPEAVDAFITKMERLQERIRSLDDEFFARLDPLLEDAQRPSLEHLRLARARQRLQADDYFGMGMGLGMYQYPAVDLSAILPEIDLAPETRAELDPVMLQYERQLTRRMQDLHDTAGKLARDSIIISQDPGLEARQRMAELVGPILKGTTDLAKFNQLSARQIAERLTQEGAEAFRVRYLSRAYPDLGRLAGLGREPWLRTAPQARDLTDAQRAEVAAAIDQYRQAEARLVDEVIPIIDAYRASCSPYSKDQQAAEAYSQEISLRLHKGTDLNEMALHTLGAILGKEWLAGARGDVPAQQALGNMATGGAGAGAAPGRRLFTKSMTVAGGDAWLPAAISTNDVAAYIKQLALDETMQAIIRQLHSDYAKAVAQLPVLAELPGPNPEYIEFLGASAGRMRIVPTDPATGKPVLPGPQEIERLNALRRKGFNAICKLDKAFFESFQEYALPEQLEQVAHLRRSRERRAYWDLSALRLQNSTILGARECSVDLVDVCNDAISREERQAIEPLLTAYETSMISPLRARYEAGLDDEAIQDRRIFATAAAGADEAARQEAEQRSETEWKANWASRKQADTRLLDLNRGTRDAIIAALPEATRSAFSRAYNQAAYPEIYKDATCLSDHLSRALTLQDLSPDQLTGVSALANSYWVDYEALCQKMIPQCGMFDDADATKQWDEFGKLRFERDELNIRAINRLKGLLSASQIKELGGLPQPKERR